MAYSPLGRGFLTGTITTQNDLDPTDARHYFPRLQGDNLTRVEILKTFEHSKNCAPAQICLAWILAKGSHMTVIPGTRHRSYLEKNCKSSTVHLTSQEIFHLDNVFPFGSAKGDRYPSAIMEIQKT